MAGNFFRGTSVEQDGRWGKSDERLMAKMASKGMFASILETKINIKKVNVDVISKWITQKVIEVRVSPKSCKLLRIESFIFKIS